MLSDLTFPCYLTTLSGKKCLSGKVICAFFCPAYRSSPVLFILGRARSERQTRREREERMMLQQWRVALRSACACCHRTFPQMYSGGSRRPGRPGDSQRLSTCPCPRNKSSVGCSALLSLSAFLSSFENRALGEAISTTI
jgi:hypothetical protein